MAIFGSIIAAVNGCLVFAGSLVRRPDDLWASAATAEGLRRGRVSRMRRLDETCRKLAPRGISFEAQRIPVPVETIPGFGERPICAVRILNLVCSAMPGKPGATRRGGCGNHQVPVRSVGPTLMHAGAEAQRGAT